MKNLGKVARVFTSLVMFAMAVMLIVAITGFNPVIVAVVLIAVSLFIPMPSGVALDTIVESWRPYIIARFFKDNGFMKNTFDDSDSVLNGRIVHIPQIGSKPAVQLNRTVFPATATRRADTDVTYALGEYTTDPTHIPNIDSINISYNKQDSVLGDHMAVLTEAVADNMLIKWAGDAALVKTTGANSTATPTTVSPVGGQTGTRLAFTSRDLQGLMIRMNTDNVPKQDRFILIDDNMFDAFYGSIGDTNAKDFSRYADAENGVIGKLHGFSIITRSSVIAATNANAIKALGSVLGATDSLCSIAWQKNSIAHAIGSTMMFQRTNDPLYYGDVYSTLVMAGGRVRRADAKGVYVIAQG
jgi:hypothetical protein